MIGKFKNRIWLTCRRGQSLMEVVVAMGVVLFVLISIVVLVLINSFGQKGSENKVIASNLAREGIEAFRNLRDTAKLQKKDIDFNPVFSSTNHYRLPTLNALNNLWSLAMISADFFETYSRLWFKDGLYQQNNPAPSDPKTYTIFQRQLTIDPMCALSTECGDGIDDVGDADCSSCTNVIGYRVKSEVRWLENNQAVSISLTDFLYDWR